MEHIDRLSSLFLGVVWGVEGEGGVIQANAVKNLEKGRRIYIRTPTDWVKSKFSAASKLKSLKRIL